MGFKFRKSINLGNGFRINVSNRGIGASAGTRGARITRGRRNSRQAGVSSSDSYPITPARPSIWRASICNCILPGSAFFFIGNAKLAIFWIIGCILALFLATELSLLAFIGSFVHYFIVRNSQA